jgi:hypothetical protein
MLKFKIYVKTCIENKLILLKFQFFEFLLLFLNYLSSNSEVTQ